MGALNSILAIMLVSTIGITPSSCTTTGGGTSDAGMSGRGDGGGGGGYLIQFPSEFAVPWSAVP
jgi:hypothetical protein